MSYIRRVNSNTSLSDRILTALARHCIFPLQEVAKGHRSLGVLNQMRQDEHLPIAELKERQSARLRNLLVHSLETVPYYRERFSAYGITLQGMPNPECLKELPFLTKEDIRTNLEAMKSSTAKKVTQFATGGSTGSPLIFYLGPSRISSDIAARARAEGWWGLGIGDPEFVLWGSPIEVGKQDRLRAVRDKVMRTELFSAFEMTETMMDSYVERLCSGRYRRVFGYPSSIALLSARATETGKDLASAGVRAVFVTGESLIVEWRSLISETFGCPVANGYGGRDSGFIAHECPSGGMHTTADRIIVEIVDEEGKSVPAGTPGEIVVTHLDTFEMPMIRYRTGDVGALSTKVCSCGRTLPLMERIDGRQTDFILTPDGRTMHGLSVIYILREVEGIKQFRIIQKELDQIDVEVVPGPSYSKECEPRIREGFCKRLRAQVTVNIRYIDQIPSTKSGKFRYVISEIGTGRGRATVPESSDAVKL